MIKNTLPYTDLKTSDFNYELPQELIAQTPLSERDASRLLVLRRDSDQLEHRIFKDITDYLHDGDVLVINDSKVIPARLYGKKADNGLEMEVLLLRQHSTDVWETLLRPARRAKSGTNIIFGDGLLCAEVIETVEDGNRLLKFSSSGAELYSLLDKIGNIPLPPYITVKLAEKDKNRYQTVYAKEEGSAAAPTAGLHFTETLLDNIRLLGVKIIPVMLHVGLGTFRPVKVENIAEHVMHSEYFSVSEESAELINSRKGRLIAVGTTSCRTLESASDSNGIIHPLSGDTGIFIYPPYKFKAVQALITNFHLPQSTLLMLVSAFAGREKILSAYNTAVLEKYRFFSFGDAMFIY